jgi:hypothetical protein
MRRAAVLEQLHSLQVELANAQRGVSALPDRR